MYLTYTTRYRRDGYDEGFAAGREDGLQVGIKQGIEQGLEQGAYETKLETAKLLLSYGDSPEKVTRCSKLPLEVVQGLIQDQ